MKKNVLVPFVCLIVLFALMNACGGGKYSDVLKLNQEFVGIIKTYVDDLDKAGNANDVAKAMNLYADGLEKIWPQMKKVSEKYPELKDKNNPPEEIRASQKEAEEWGKKMVGTFMKIMPYMEDPEVKKAQARLSAAMK